MQNLLLLIKGEGGFPSSLSLTGFIVRLSVNDVYQSWQQSEELMLLVELREKPASLHNQLMFHSVFYL